MKTVMLLTMLPFLVACSLPIKLVQRDLASVEVIAKNRGEPAVAECAATLNKLLQDKLDLSSEDADGVLALAFKAYLRSKGNPELEAAFKKDCGPVAVGLLLEAGKALR